MSSLFIIGNRFDIAHGIPSKYSDFRKYLVKKGENQVNFEDSLAHNTIDQKFPEPVHKENETEEEDNILMRDYLLYMKDRTKAFNRYNDST